MWDFVDVHSQFYSEMVKNMHHSGTSCYKTLNTCKTACFHCISYSRLTCPTKR
jgi:hypothetical protein